MTGKRGKSGRSSRRSKTLLPTSKRVLLHQRGERVPSSNSKASTVGVVTKPGMFVFPGQISIDAKSTLDQLTPQFRSVRDGLPELVKNAKDQYARLQIR